eukprot:2363506-Prymnesium_polylepis.1
MAACALVCGCVCPRKRPSRRAVGKACLSVESSCNSLNSFSSGKRPPSSRRDRSAEHVCDVSCQPRHRRARVAPDTASHRP